MNIKSHEGEDVKHGGNENHSSLREKVQFFAAQAGADDGKNPAGDEADQKGD